MDRSIKVWDVRSLTGPLQDYKVRTSPRSMVFSQTGCLAVAINNVVDVSIMLNFFEFFKLYFIFRFMKNVVQKL